MSDVAPVTFSADADDMGWIIFDDPAARANVFNAVSQAALSAAIDAAEKQSLKTLVIISAKEKIFIAGADLKWLASVPDAATAIELSHAGQQLFQRLADFPVPVICAIHGACAGGGFELALACHWRIASDAAVTHIGLPETSIGTIPGWGGSVRLPRLIGAKAALDHILKAQLVGAADALQGGLVDELVPAAELKTRAKLRALELAAGKMARTPAHPMPLASDFFRGLRDSITARTRGQQPALLAAIDAVEQTVSLPVPEALEVEAEIFAKVTAGEVCKNLIRVFFLRDRAKKRTLDGWFEAKAALGPIAPSVKRVGIVGAGVMGSGIAQWLAAHGFDVVIRDVQPELLDRGMMVIRGLFTEAVKRGKTSEGDAERALQRVTMTTNWDGFAGCDLIIEAIVENVAAKQALFSELATVVRKDALLASNTSALPIEEIAGHVPNPSRTLGVHFFNPVSRMPLVELILGRETSAEAAERALALIKSLGKSPVICRSSPGFLVTRVLFFYLNEAVRLWEAGAGTNAIDAALRDFGWPMGPLRLIDEVGVDVTDFIFGELAHYIPSRFTRSTACGRMIAAGLKGRKNGASRGFYRYDGSQESVNEAETRQLTATRTDTDSKNVRDVPEPDFARQLMRVMVDEAERCLAEGIVKSPDDVDFALLSGAGFPAFRGGLLHWARRHGDSV